jgi:hypothetical protein
MDCASTTIFIVGSFLLFLSKTDKKANRKKRGAALILFRRKRAGKTGLRTGHFYEKIP